MSQSNNTTKGSAQADPEIENVLASIRRIMSEDVFQDDPSDDDTALKPKPHLVSVPTTPPPQDDDTLLLSNPIAPDDVRIHSDILSETAATASQRSFALLSETLQTSTTQASSDALESMVQNMLRPLLRQWLDRHLPNIVDEIVSCKIDEIVQQQMTK